MNTHQIIGYSIIMLILVLYGIDGYMKERKAKRKRANWKKYFEKGL